MMMADVKRLSEAERLDLTRCEEKLDKALAARRLDADLIAAATTRVEGERRWFALRVGKCGELELCQRLVGEGVDAVVPVKQVRVTRRTGSRGAVVHRPVLRSLVFVSIVPSVEAYAGLLRMRGVAAIVGSGERPHPIGEREMLGFMDLAQKGAFDERATPTGLKVGSNVRIKVGDRADMAGVLVGYAKGRTARVRTHLFGGKVLIDVKLAQLEGID
jgi:transcription termination/antitermination protein NusG